MNILEVQEFIFNKRREFNKLGVDPIRLIFIFNHKDYVNLKYSTEIVKENIGDTFYMQPFGQAISWAPVVSESEILTAIK